MLSQSIPILCPLCHKPMTTTGEHQTCALSCGHIFGYECLQEYFKQTDECPICKNQIHQREILMLFFANHIPYKDSILQQKHAQIKKLEADNQKLKDQKQMCKKNLEQLNQELASTKVPLYKQEEKQVIKVLSYPSIVFERPVNDGSRLLLCNDKLFFSEKMDDGNYGIQMTDIGDPDEFVFFPVHNGQIRDIAAFENSSELIVTVSVDKTIGIVNTTTRNVQRFQTNVSLWSCCFVTPDLVVVGGDRSTIMCFNLNRQQPLFEVSQPGPPIISMDLVDVNLLFVCNGRQGMLFDIETRQYLTQTVVQNATLVRSMRSNLNMNQNGSGNRKIAVLVRKDKEARAMIYMVNNRNLIVSKNITISYFSKLARPSLCQANNILYSLFPNESDNDFAFIDTRVCETNLWLKWKGRFPKNEKPYVDMSLYILDDFLLVALTQDLIRIYALPIEF